MELYLHKKVYAHNSNLLVIGPGMSLTKPQLKLKFGYSMFCCGQSVYVKDMILSLNVSLFCCVLKLGNHRLILRQLDNC